MSKIAVWRNHNNGEEGEMPYDDWMKVRKQFRSFGLIRIKNIKENDTPPKEATKEKGSKGE